MRLTTPQDEMGDPLGEALPFDSVEVFMYLTAQLPDKPLEEVRDLTLNWQDWEAQRSHCVVPVDDPSPARRVARGLWCIVVAVALMVTVFVFGYVWRSSPDIWTGPFRDPMVYHTTDGRTVTVWGRHRVTKVPQGLHTQPQVPGKGASLAL